MAAVQDAQSALQLEVRLLCLVCITRHLFDRRNRPLVDAASKFEKSQVVRADFGLMKIQRVDAWDDADNDVAEGASGAALE